ncbi:tetratricopeptide repeat protein [Noviherbaspirillum pedocola]|uniref:Tetratricopeptide repeat protein n=1 Tax=Noviherbaspirillum pedocola TaxID=2801341 RepID=A0A934T055_9BURK|nr:tetratricopeptide repeat protein [Noviherbaspirillum pedocola]MBK4738231.1 tetratricopeptide repeat protein [Noviherbaspirillum pedocola]
MSSAPPTPSKRHGTWHAFDAPSERQKLFSPWTIVGFGLTVGLGLALVYPHRALEHRLAAADSAAGSGALAIEYLKVFVKADPSAGEMRLQLVKKLAQAGDSDSAERLLDAPQAKDDPAIRREAPWIRLALAEERYYAAAPDSPAREAAQARLRQRLAALLEEPLGPHRLATLGTHALADAEPALARAAFARLAQLDATLPAVAYRDAARGALGVGDYASSARLRFLAMERASDLAERREDFLAALKILQSGGLLQQALDEAEHRLGPLAADTDVLKFLARLARSANRPDIAERYAKRFLELTLMERMRAWEGMRLVAWHGERPHGNTQAVGARVMRIADAAPGNGPGLAFDEEAYSLGYDIFLSNRNLADALRVAQSAARQRPQSALWRKRLAEVSEWSGAPREALDAWLAHARMSGEEASWDAALRLSDSLFDGPALREALEHKLAREPMGLNWLNRLLALDELSGEPGRAIARLQQRLARGGLPAAEREREMTLLADIQERAGRDADALATVEGLQRAFGPRTGYALKIANLHFRRGELEPAFAALEAARGAAAADDALYWKNYAELARLLGRDNDAERGYRALVAAGLQSPADVSNLIALWQHDRPRDAAALAADAYLRGGEPALAEEALSLWATLSERNAARAFLARLSPQQQAALEKRAAFLIQRAALKQSGEDLPGARTDLRAALVIDPANVEARAALVWVLIALRDTEPLKEALRQWSPQAVRSPALWEAFAAAAMSLNRQDEALRWFSRFDLKSRRNDVLWLMAYAECLEANSRTELAWRIRRQAWDLLRDPQTIARLRPGQFEAMRERLASLAPQFAGGEGAWRVMQMLLRADAAQIAAQQAAGKGADIAAPAQNPRELIERLDREMAHEARGSGAGSAGSTAGTARLADVATLLAAGTKTEDARLAAGAREVALSYALNADGSDLARAWLAARYAGQVARPLYAELSLALQDDDRNSLNRLLDNLADWLPMYDRIDAARRAQRPALAQTLAFDQLARLPDDEQLHQRLVELTTENGPKLSVGTVHRSESPLVTTETRIDAATQVTPGLRFSMALSEKRQRSDDGAQLLDPPSLDRRLALTVTRSIDTGSISATLQRRQALAGTTGAKLAAEAAPLRDLQVSGAIGVNQAAIESVPLMVGGMRHLVEASATYALTSRAYLRMDLGWQRFLSQGGAALGSGRSWRLEAGQRLRIDYPDITLSAYLSGNRFAANGNFDAQIASILPAGADPATTLLPQGSRTVGLLLATGANAEAGYHRAWRPYGAVGISTNTVTGHGYELRGGAAGSVLGGDMLRLYLDRTAATPAAQQGSREIGLKYDAFY